MRNCTYQLFTSGSTFVAVLAAAAFAFTGCDSSTGPEGAVTFQGRVTDEAGFGKASANIEGAVVTAANVTASGTSSISGEATTSAEGRFSLNVDDAADEVVLTAQKAGFRTRTMAYAAGRSTVQTMPMTVESYGEADVLIKVRGRSDAEDVTMSNVAVYVTEDVAADVIANDQSAADVAATIAAEARARTSFVREAGEEDEVDDARDNENDAFVILQAALSTSTSASAEAAALEAFESALIKAYSDAGVSLETQAKARQAARAAVKVFSSGSTSFHLQKKAELLAAIATSQAIEASFEADGASSARLSALAQARSTLVSGIRNAASLSAITAAKANYSSSVEAELASESQVSASALTTASTAMQVAKAALDVAVNTASSATAVATAHATFYANAETAAETSLGSATTKASLAANVLALLKAS